MFSPYPSDFPSIGFSSIGFPPVDCVSSPPSVFFAEEEDDCYSSISSSPYSPSPHLSPERKREAAAHGRGTNHLFNHRGNLYFRIRIPKELQDCLGVKEYRRSLQTHSRRVAKIKASRLYSAAQDVFELARDCLKSRQWMMKQMTTKTKEKREETENLPQQLEKLAQLTDEDIQGIAIKWLKEAVKEDYEYRMESQQFTRSEDEKEAISNLGIEALETLLEGSKPPSHTQRNAFDSLASQGILEGFSEWSELGEKEQQELLKSVPFRKLCREFLRAEVAYVESILDPFTDGNISTSHPFTKSEVERYQSIQQNAQQKELLEKLERLRSAPAAKEAKQKEKATMILSQAVERYIKAKTPEWSQRTRKDMPRRVISFKDIILELNNGNDILITKIDRQMLRKYRDILTKQPRRRTASEYKGKTSLELADLNLPPEQCLATKTVTTCFTGVQSFFNWLELEDDTQTFNPKRLNAELTPPKPKPGEKKRRAFTDEELCNLFEPKSYLQATKNKPERYWTPLLALYTGARINELCQLAVEDIKLVDGVWCIDLNNSRKDTSLKTESAKRIIPIHPFLLHDMGLLSYIEQLKKDGEIQLFPNLKYNPKTANWSDSTSKWFTRYRRSCDVGNTSETSDVTFHSFRHTVADELIKHKQANPHIVQEVLGHESNLGVTENYTGAYPVKVLLEEAIMKLDFHERIEGLRGLKKEAINEQ